MVITMLFNRFKAAVVSLICFIMLLTSLLGCTQKDALPINDIIATELIDKGIENSKIISFCDNTSELGILHSYSSVSITEDEIAEYVDIILLSHEKLLEITDRNIVKKGDAITASYLVSYNSKLISNFEKEQLLVGSGKYDVEFENAVIGAVVGEPFVCEIKANVDGDNYSKGDLLKYNIIVESIAQFKNYKSDDKYILDFYGCKSENDFLNFCKEKLLNEKKRESIEKTDNAFLDRVAEDCRFKIDKREAAEYSEKIVEEYKNLAYVNGFEFEDYLKTELNTSKDEFYDFCYDEGVKEIKRYLLIGAVSYDMPSYEYSFANFCSMSGYDSTKTDEYEGVFAWTVYYYAQNHSDGSKDGLVGLAPQNYDFEYTVRIYNSTSVDCIDLSDDGDYTLSQETQEELIKTLQTLSPKTIKFDTCNHIYDTVVVFTDSQTGTDTVLMIDGKNSFVKYKSKNKLVYSDYSDDFAKIINSVKQG